MPLTAAEHTFASMKKPTKNQGGAATMEKFWSGPVVLLLKQIGTPAGGEHSAAGNELALNPESGKMSWVTACAGGNHYPAGSARSDRH